MGGLGVHPIAGDANPLAAGRDPVVAADEEVAVFLEGGMKGDAVGQGFPEMVQDFVGADSRFHGGAAQPRLRFLGVLVDEPQPAASRLFHHHHRVGQCEPGEGPHHPVGRGWVGGAGHPRGHRLPLALELLQSVGGVPVRLCRTQANGRQQKQQTQRDAEPIQSRTEGGRPVFGLESHSWSVWVRAGSGHWTADPAPGFHCEKFPACSGPARPWRRHTSLLRCRWG